MEMIEGSPALDRKRALLRAEEGRDDTIAVRGPFQVEDLKEKWEAGSFIVRPSFQRGYVWDRKTASRLIESILLKHEIPDIYVYRSKVNGKSVDHVLDGQQRMTSLFGFINGTDLWNEGGTFRLSGCRMRTALNGFTFDTLPLEYQHRLTSYQLSVVTVRGENMTAVTDLFRRLNESSYKATTQELRHCLNPGPWNDMLHSMASNPKFLRLVRLSNRRMACNELILRFLAFHRQGVLEYEKSYSGKLSQFLDSEMEYLTTNYTTEWGEKLNAEFNNALNITEMVFGNDPFTRKSGPQTRISKILFELLMCEFAKRDPEVAKVRVDEIREAFQALLTNDVFNDAIGESTGMGIKAITRFQMWQEVLDDIFRAPLNRCSDYRVKQQARQVFMNLPEEERVCESCNGVIEPSQFDEMRLTVDWSDGVGDRASGFFCQVFHPVGQCVQLEAA